jgi:hypothetical protein
LPLQGETIKAFVQARAEHVPSDPLAVTLIEQVRRELGPNRDAVWLGVRGIAFENALGEDSAELSES